MAKSYGVITEDANSIIGKKKKKRVGGSNTNKSYVTSELESDLDQSRPLIDQTLAVAEEDYGDESALLDDKSISLEVVS